MREMFSGYYRLSNDELKNLWANATFVFDANVLLNLYRYPEEARDSLLRVLRGIAGRIWLPNQAALEYQENRLTVIADQLRRFAEVREVLDDTATTLKSRFDGLQLPKRHSSINPEPLLRQVEEAIKQFKVQLAQLEKEQPKVYEDDKVRNELDVLFRDRVGEPPSQAFIEEVYEYGKNRYEHRIPPGYEDAGKAKTDKNAPVHLSNGVPIKKEFGDLVFWFELMGEAKRKSLKEVILVSDDAKEDWWWMIESAGKKTIGPRPELVEELHRQAGVAHFYMYNSERFLEYANEYLGAQVEDKSIAQVREIRELQSAESAASDSFSIARKAAIAEAAVRNWIRTSHPGVEVLPSIATAGGRVDIVTFDAVSGRHEGYEIKLVTGSVHISRRVREAWSKIKPALVNKELDAVTVVLAVWGDVDPAWVARLLKNEEWPWPSEVSVLIGRIVETDAGEDSSEALFFPLSRQ